MAQLNQTFDSNQHDDVDGFDPIPAGWYKMETTGSDVKQTQAGTGQYIALEHTVLDGEYKGRKVWNNLNIVNPNPVTVEIANKTLATLCRAIGKKVIADTVELHGIPFEGKVKIVPAKGDWPAKNGIVTYRALEGEAGAGATPDFVEVPEPAEPKAAPPAQTAAPDDGGVPWED